MDHYWLEETDKREKRMIFQRNGAIRGLWRQVHGAVAVEFAVISFIFFMLIAGVLDFGHAWYMKQIITNASREGARYGITYQTNTSGVRIAPSALNPTIQNYVATKYLANTALPSDANPSITTAGAGYTTGTKGAALEVTVAATKTWFIISGFIPGLGNQKIINAKTVMLCE
jgi:Flp pilus assembly protein TadG